MSEEKEKPGGVERLRTIWPDVRDLIWPRRGLLLLGLVLMVVNRAAGLVLPGSTKFLIDDVVLGKREDILLPLVLLVALATVVQGGTSFALTQLLSKAAQRLITDLREKVQQHVGRLPLSYFDANKTGALVSRIMNDVEGIRNLIGTGLVELLGGLLSALLAFLLMLRISPTLTLVTLAFLALFVVLLSFAFRTLRPIFRNAGASRPRSRAGCRSRWEASGWSRATTRRRAKPRCSPPE